MGRGSRKGLDTPPSRDRNRYGLVYYIILSFVVCLVGIIIVFVAFYVIIQICGKNPICMTPLGPVGEFVREHVKSTNEGLHKFFVGEDHYVPKERYPKKPPLKKSSPIESVSYVWLIVVKPAIVKVLPFGLFQ